jgi:hypothetical protein
LAIVVLTAWAVPASAQAPVEGGWFFSLDGGFAVQTEVDMEEGDGSFSLDRDFFSLGADYRWNYRNSVGLSVGGGTTEYDFDGFDLGFSGTPWSNIDDWRVSLPARLAWGETSTLFFIPSLRHTAEDGASSSDSRSWGLLAGAAWRRSEDLTIGPGLGVFSRLEDDVRVFPILLIDWNINTRWNLSTGQGLAASQGPGLTLGYQLTPSWRLGLAARFEETQFRLDESGSTPGGVGEDSSLPLIFTAGWSPSPQVRLAAFAGLKLGGELTLYDRDGERLERRGYDAAAIYGITIEFKP